MNTLISHKGANAPINNNLVDIAQYWRILKRAKWAIMLTTIVCFVIGGYIASNITPTYQATTKVLADPKAPNSDITKQNGPSSLVFLFYDTQYGIIKSRKLAERVVDKLDLVTKYKTEKLNIKDKELSTIDLIKQKINAITSQKKNTTTPAKVLTDSEIRQLIAAKIQSKVKVKGGKRSKIINISYASDDPEEAAKIINALSEAYIQYDLEARLADVKNTEFWLSEQFTQLKERLNNSEARLSEYRTSEGLVNNDQEEKLGNIQLQSLNNELIKAQTQLSSTREVYLAIQNIQPNSKEIYSLSSVLENKISNDLLKIEARLSQQVNQLVKRYGEKHPKMIAARSELKSAQEALNNEVGKVIQSLEKNYKLAEYQVSNIEGLIAQKRNEIQSLQSKNFTLISLEQEVSNNRRIYEHFQVSLMEASSKKQFTSSNIHIIDRATIPKRPAKPNKSLIIFLAGIFGLFFAVIFTFLREAMNNTFKTPDALEDKLKVPTIGITTTIKKGKKSIEPEMQYLQDARSLFSEHINTIRTGLLFSNIDNPPKTMLVTSAMGGEGKSATAINLASAFSFIGKTLLLEVDLRKPSIANAFNIQSNVGLSDVLSNNVTSLSDAITTKNNDQLHILPCGALVHNPFDLLSSNKFERLLTELKAQYDYVILDSSPTLPVSDSCMLANKVDGVILTVKADDTRIKVAKEAVNRLQKLNANIIGSVLTIAEPSKMSDYGEHYDTGVYYGTKPEKVNT